MLYLLRRKLNVYLANGVSLLRSFSAWFYLGEFTTFKDWFSAVLIIDPGFAKIVSIALSLKRRLGVVAVHQTDYKTFPML